MSTAPADEPTSRPLSWFMAHIAAAVTLALIPLYLLIAYAPFPVDGIAFAVFIAAAVVNVIATTRHGMTACPRCVQVRHRKGVKGARRRLGFILAFHNRKGIVRVALLFVFVGVAASVALEGGFEHAASEPPAVVGVCVALGLIAAADYTAISHTAFADSCGLDHRGTAR